MVVGERLGRARRAGAVVALCGLVAGVAAAPAGASGGPTKLEEVREVDNPCTGEHVWLEGTYRYASQDVAVWSGNRYRIRYHSTIRATGLRGETADGVRYSASDRTVSRYQEHRAATNYYSIRQKYDRHGRHGGRADSDFHLEGVVQTTTNANGELVTLRLLDPPHTWCA